MAEVINLRRARKQKKRKDKAAKAAANRITFGQSKSDKAAIEISKERNIRNLDAHKREKPDEQGE
ncbi:MAG: DUF4169 family protein [Pseudomonadota bacterium]